MNEGHLFRKLRKDRGLSIEQVSDELNSVSFISKFEKGGSNISMHRLERLLQNINVSFEEFLYLRQLEREPNLNQDIKILQNYLTNDFYFYVAKLTNIVNQVNSVGFEKSIDLMNKLKQEMNPQINWQKFIMIYCDVSITSYLANLEEDETRTVDKTVEEINYLTKPVISYLYKVENWGVFEMILFKLFLFSFKAEQIHQLLPTAISRIEKESQFSVMRSLKLDIIFSSFSYFVNFRHQKWAKESLVMARNMLKNQKDLVNSTFLLFYEGWYTLIFEDKEEGLQSCYQAISIFRILDQPTLENRYKEFLKHVLLNKEEPEGYLIFV